MPLTSGATFAGFKIVRLLGAGGMGQVYLVEHPRLPRSNALKVLAPEVSADPDYRERFIREEELAATLWHPNIVGVHDRGEFKGQLWISMDYVPGTNASELLKRSYPTVCRCGTSSRSLRRSPERWTTRINAVSCTATLSRQT